MKAQIHEHLDRVVEGSQTKRGLSAAFEHGRQPGKLNSHRPAIHRIDQAVQDQESTHYLGPFMM